MSLKIAPNLSLPAEAVTQTFAILAKRGVGKTYTASVMVEEMLKAQLPVVVVDPIGVWWGLRSGADGKSPGLPIIIAGGEHADVPIEPTSGEVLANLVVDQRVSLVVDLSRFRKGEQTRFMTDFAETLYHRNREALHMVIDEADAFAPQRPMKGQERMLGAMEDLVRRGRARGIGMTLITQRPAVLHKDVLTQVEVLVAMRLIAPQDRNAVDDWVKVHGEPGQREELMQSLPSLPIGTAWFWSPGWLDLFKRVEIRKRETLDSSSTPKVGQKAAAGKMAKVDIDVLREQLAATIERVEQDDPKVLRRRIVELEREVRQQPTKQVEIEKPYPVEVPVISQGDFDRIVALAEPLIDLIREVSRFLPETNQTVPSFSTALEPKRPIQKPQPQAINPIDSDTDVGINLRAGERRILQVLAQHYPMRFTRNQLGTLSKFTPSGGTFGNYFGNLKRQGLIEDNGGEVVILQEGLEYLGADVPAPQTTEEILAMWREALRAGERKMLDELVDAYPQAIPRAELGERTGFTASGGTFGNYLGSLRRNGLIEVEDGSVRASDSLFLTGARR